MRELGIPTVTDRLIQQALLQVLQPIIDPTFSEHSYGFRPGRRARDAVLKAQRHVQEGYRVVVDVDLEKFFDRVNHDILTERLSRRIADKAVLRLVRHYLVAGIMDGGWSWSVTKVRRKVAAVAAAGQCAVGRGGPGTGDARPSLRALRRRLQCVRAQSPLGRTSVDSLRKLYDRLHLKVNEAKTAVAQATGRKFLAMNQAQCGRADQMCGGPKGTGDL